LLHVRDEFGSFRFVDGATRINRWRRPKDIPATTQQSDAMSQDLKRRGFKFEGSTICYAHMQATGMVNDHITSCFRYRELT
jgi:DNA-3-methyladenine glycosylase I